MPSPKLTHKDLRYGPHERHTLDLFLPDRHLHPGPHPLMLYFHGGAFTTGKKSDLPRSIKQEALRHGFALASANYRYTTDAPIPAALYDGVAAARYLIDRDETYHLDISRIVVSGKSAGAGIALWMAYPPEPDELLSVRGAPESSRLDEIYPPFIEAVAVVNAQSSYDPRVINAWFGFEDFPDKPLFCGAYGLNEAEMDQPEAHALYDYASSIKHLRHDSPPCYLLYTQPDLPLKSQMTIEWLHHPTFGHRFLEEAEQQGVSVILKNQYDEASNASPIPAMLHWLHEQVKDPSDAE